MIKCVNQMRVTLFVAFLVTITSVLLTREAQALSKMQTLENLVYPWPGRDEWPSLKMSYNYVVSGHITGSEIVKDGTYTYSKAKGYNEPKVEREFSYYAQVKVDSKNKRAVQRLWTDETRQVLLSTSAMDFENARLMFVEHEEPGLPGHCKVYQF